MPWLNALVTKLEGLLSAFNRKGVGASASDQKKRRVKKPGAFTAPGAGDAAGGGAPEVKAPAAGWGKQPPADTTGVLHRDAGGAPDRALSADGTVIHRVGGKWYDDDGNWVAYVPLLTKDQAIAKARAGGYGGGDTAAGAAGAGIKKAFASLPIVGGIIAGNIDTGNGALSPAEILENQRILRTQAAEVILQDDIDAGSNKTAGGRSVYEQLDPALLPDNYDDMDVL